MAQAARAGKRRHRAAGIAVTNLPVRVPRGQYDSYRRTGPTETGPVCFAAESRLVRPRSAWQPPPLARARARLPPLRRGGRLLPLRRVRQPLGRAARPLPDAGPWRLRLRPEWQPRRAPAPPTWPAQRLCAPPRLAPLRPQAQLRRLALPPFPHPVPRRGGIARCVPRRRRGASVQAACRNALRARGDPAPASADRRPAQARELRAPCPRLSSRAARSPTATTSAPPRPEQHTRAPGGPPDGHCGGGGTSPGSGVSPAVVSTPA